MGRRYLAQDSFENSVRLALRPHTSACHGWIFSSRLDHKRVTKATKLKEKRKLKTRLFYTTRCIWVKEAFK